MGCGHLTISFIKSCIFLNKMYGFLTCTQSTPQPKVKYFKAPKRFQKSKHRTSFNSGKQFLFFTSIMSSWLRYKWNPSMGRAMATSVWVVPLSPSTLEFFWSHKALTRLVTSFETVDLPAPGGPANPTIYLNPNTCELINWSSSKFWS